MKEIPFINSRIGMTIVFWLMSLFLIPLFALMWGLPLMFLCWMIFEVIGSSQPGFVMKIFLTIQWLAGVITVVLLCKQYKKHFIEHVKSQKVADSD